MLSAMVQGLGALFDPIVIAYMMGGVMLGLVIGILPGLSGLTGLAILIPLVFGMDRMLAFAFLMGMYAPACTGGSVTAVLLNVPGTGSNAATLLDGFPMTQQGHSGRALGNALTASALGGVFGGVVLLLVIPIIRPVVMAFGSPESFILILIGISYIAFLGGGSVSKGLLAGGLGLALSLIGYQGVTAVERYTFGSLYLFDGIRLVPLALGLFAIPEAVNLITTGRAIAKTGMVTTARSDLLQGVKDVFHHWRLFLRTSAIGTLIGAIPGVGGDVAVWVAYGHAKQTSKHPERFGHGSEEGIIAPESANNAKEGGGLIPTVAFGIPGSAAMAVMLGAFIIVGLQPGPLLLRDHLDIVFSLAGLLILANIVGAGILFIASQKLALIAFIRGHIIGPLILILVALGAYAVYNDMLDVFSAFIMGGLLGVPMRQFGYSRPALFLGYVLGALGETYFYISLETYGWLFPIIRPVALALILVAGLGLSYKRIARVLRRG